MENQLENFNKIDRNVYTRKMTEELANLMAQISLSCEELSQKLGIDKRELEKMVHGERELEWSEYLAILYLFWRNDKIRQVIEEKGLFPDELKQMMAVNRKG